MQIWLSLSYRLCGRHKRYYVNIADNKLMQTDSTCFAYKPNTLICWYQLLYSLLTFDK